MNIKEIKKEMKAYRDFYGGELFDHNEIDKATTKVELAKIIENHRVEMEERAKDADSHLDAFKKRIGLLIYQH